MFKKSVSSRALLPVLSGIFIFLSQIHIANAAEGAEIDWDSAPGAFHTLYFVGFAAIAAIAYGLFLRTRLMAKSPGTEAMQRVGDAIRAGAHAYLAKQVKAMLPLVLILSVLLFVFFSHQAAYTTRTALGLAIAFIAGVTCSYAAGYLGMGMATEGNQRTANAALSSYKDALETAFRSGAVAGLMTVGLGMLGAVIIFMIFPTDAMYVLVGFGFGGSLAALFMRVGGESLLRQRMSAPTW